MSQTVPTPSQTPAPGHYAAVNGVNMYYETYGTGQPLVLLHGGLGSSEMFGDVLPQLAASRHVIAAHLQGHGRTADIDRPLSFEAMADDVAALIRRLGFAKADIMGYSLGGGAAWQTAIRHPEAVRKLVTISAPVKRTGWYPEVLAGMAQMGPEAAEAMQPSPMYQLHARIAPRPEEFPVLLGKLGQLLRQDYDWSPDVARIQAPVMVVVGDADSVRPVHAVETFALLGGGLRDAGLDGSGMPRSRLAILPGTTHYTIFASPMLASVVTPFLDAPMPQAQS